MIPGFPTVGATELIILVFILVLLFGAKRIPDLARSLGRGTRELREGIRGAPADDRDEIRGHEEKDEEKPPPEGAARGETSGAKASGAAHRTGRES